MQKNLILHVGSRKKIASAESEATAGSWGCAPSAWGPVAKPLVRGSGGRNPPETETNLKNNKAIFDEICNVKLCKIQTYS